MNDAYKFEGLDTNIALTDAEGKVTKFELLDLIEYEGGKYAVLLPKAKEKKDGKEVVILMLGESDNSLEDIFLSVDDENVVNKVYDIFREDFKDKFNFIG